QRRIIRRWTYCAVPPRHNNEFRTVRGGAWMDKRPRQPEADVARRLAAALRPGSPNGITAAQLPGWAVGYPRGRDPEGTGTPHVPGEPHRNLWMMDVRYEDALFAVLVFRPGEMEFFCGTGDAFAIKRFAESDFPEDVEQVRAEMVRCFTVPEDSLLLGREEA